MDMESWAELARLARKAKAELETRHPRAVREIASCEDVVALAEGATMGDAWSDDSGTFATFAEWTSGATADQIPADELWTGDPEVLAARYEGATAVAVAVHNTTRPNEAPDLLLGGVDDATRVFMTWFAGGGEGVQREGMVMPRRSGVYPDIAYVLLQEYRAADTGATDAGASAEADASIH